MHRLVDHAAIILTIFFTVYGQLIMRWQVSHAGPLPPSLGEKAMFVAVLLFKPWVLTAIAASFLAGVSWMLAMTRFEVSYAYPFMSLNFVLVLLMGALLLNEPLTLQKTLGVGLIVAGTIVASRG
ncbi:MAG: EamA family transporter [Rhodocyclaceae bacterium]|nr:EamA family transporter [Rhodocyclaceae bacterium]